MTNASTSTLSSQILLERIACALARPVSDFDSDNAVSIAADTTEFIRLWMTLDQPAHREKVLAFVREVAAASSCP